MSKRIVSILLSLILVFGVFAVMPLTTTAITLESFNTFNGHSYELYVGCTTWKEAKAICEEKGGYLAVVNSAEENEFLSAILEETIEYCWIGGTDEGSEGNWCWVNGDEFAYSNWNDREPNNSEEIEHYLELTSGGKWNDLSNNNDSLEGFICEYDSLKVPYLVKVTEYNNHKYELYALSKTWWEAKAICEEKGGYLAVVNSAEENEVLSAFAKGSVEYCWLGGSDEDSEGSWYWVNGDEFTYTNWNEGEPNNSEEIEHYLELVARNDKEYGKWNDLSEDNDSIDGFICEYDLTYILGDADDDEDVSAIDVTLIQRYCADFNINAPLEVLMHGDVDDSGDLDILDATLIQRYLADFNVQYPIGQWV